MPRAKRRPRFEIWQAGSRIHSEDNPVRLRLLRLLETGPRRLTELVAKTGKAKSTLSALHVPPLVRAGLIEEAPDPHDARVKIYRLKGHRLGSSDVEAPKLRDAVISYVQSQGALPLPLMLRIVAPNELLNAGAPQPYTDGVAKRIGEVLARVLVETKPSAVVAELSTLLSGAGLGSVSSNGDGFIVHAREQELSRFLELVAAHALAARLGRSVLVRSKP